MRSSGFDPKTGRSCRLRNPDAVSRPGRLVAVEMGLLPRARHEIPEQRERRPGRFLRLRVDVAPESLPAGLGDGLCGHRAERDALRAPACIQKQDPAPPPVGRTRTPRQAIRLSQTVYSCSPAQRRAMAASVSFMCSPVVTGQFPTALPIFSTASSTIASAACVYFNVVSALRWPNSLPMARTFSPRLSARLACA